MTKKISIVVLDYGYVESTGLASLVCFNEHQTFDTEAAAVKDLAEDLLAKYKDRFDKTRPSSKACCANARAANKDNEYCNKCGRSLDMEFDVGAFKDWIRELVSQDLDSYGYDETCGDREMTWEVGTSASYLLGKKSSEVACVEQAEEHLLEVLGMEDPY